MFTHLHVHTEYSLLDGMCRIHQLVKRAKELGMDSLAITDHGAMYGVIQFYVAAREAGIKPIIGCEVYVALGSRFDHASADKGNYHLLLLAKNQTGYHNLIQLITRANLEGFYYKPRVDRELLKQYHEGLIALTACIAGEVPRLILEGRIQEAKESALWYKQIFGDYYLEIQRQPVPELEPINRGLVSLGSELNIPLVATNDVHYINREDAAIHDILLCIGTNTTINDEKRMKMASDSFYLRSPQEMAEAYKDIPEALENTRRIAEMCNLTLEFGRLHLPEIEIPEGKTPDEYLAGLCHEGLYRHYPNPSPELIRRLDYELEVIKQTQFANYFLVVWDIISFTRKQNILFGVRGSAAASIVLHCLHITEVDPIANKLVFERFLNVERHEMPDIDMDFEDHRRQEVIDYVSGKYGLDHVAQIITFGTLGARAALRDVGRALGMSYGDVDRVARLVPFALNMTLDRAMEESGELRDIYQADNIIRNLIDTARKVEGISRHASTHAAGVVISKQPLTNHIPLQRVSKGDSDSTVMTQFSMEDIARIGLLKMDFLGLANLTVLGKAKEIIRQYRNIDINLHDIPMDDARTFELLASGETAGVFQLEGSGMRRHIKDLKPTTFSDIAAMVALYRPGPMEHIPRFIRAKHGEEPIRYPHPTLESILKETYGVIVYQEQVLFIVQALAGYSLGQADIFRKAMGKKIAEVMKKEKVNFMKGAKKNGFTGEIAEEVFALIEPFAGYAFNKAHATSYALIAYQTAFLKANYPAEYMTALLTAYADQTEKVAGAIAECRRLGLTVLPPDINQSNISFSIEKKVDGSLAIRFGLTAIKNVGQGAVEPIIAERDRGGPFKSVEDLCHRADLRSVNKRVMESLIKVGALDSVGSWASLLLNIDRILSLAQREHQLRETGQSTMFDFWGQAAPSPVSSLELEPVDAPIKDKLGWEKELTGVYLSDHPLSAMLSKAGVETTLCGQIDLSMEGKSVTVAGMVVSVRQLLTRDRRPFASAVLEDLDGQIEVMVWPKVYASTTDLWQEGNMLLVQGRVKKSRDDQAQIGCEGARPYEPPVARKEEVEQVQPETAEPVNEPVVEATPAVSRCIVISIKQTDDESSDVARLSKLINLVREYPGQDRVSLRVLNGGKVINLKFSGLYAHYCPELHLRVKELLGEDGLRLEP